MAPWVQQVWARELTPEAILFLKREGRGRGRSCESVDESFLSPGPRVKRCIGALNSTSGREREWEREIPSLQVLKNFRSPYGVAASIKTAFSSSLYLTSNVVSYENRFNARCQVSPRIFLKRKRPSRWNVEFGYILYMEVGWNFKQ